MRAVGQDSAERGSAPRIAVLCDFDGTISEREVLGMLFRGFAASGMEHVWRWQCGQIDMREELRATFDTVRASKEEMERALDTIKIDPGFFRFLELARQRNYSLAIVSDGLDWYIRYILGLYAAADIPVFANRIVFGPDGIRIEFPWFDEQTPRRGVCKPKIAQAFRSRHAKVVYIGDGQSDVEVIREANLVFARGWLAGYCHGAGIEFVEFRDWDDLMVKWREP
jgi:2-hydroxy-3-keto-5-methylthiopentenyl-1-phosphate phosphatase